MDKNVSKKTYIHVGTPWSPLLRSTNAANINVIIHNEKCFLLRNSILASVEVAALTLAVVVMDEFVAVDDVGVAVGVGDGAGVHQRRRRM